MNHYDSLVPFFSSLLTMLATMNTNEPLWLIGIFFCFSLNYAGYNQYQRVITTYWCLFFSSLSTTLATTSTNKPLWLVGCFFCLYLDHHYNITSSSLLYCSCNNITVYLKYKFIVYKVYIFTTKTAESTSLQGLHIYYRDCSVYKAYRSAFSTGLQGLQTLHLYYRVCRQLPGLLALHQIPGFADVQLIVPCCHCWYE